MPWATVLRPPGAESPLAVAVCVLSLSSRKGLRSIHKGDEGEPTFLLNFWGLSLIAIEIV